MLTTGPLNLIDSAMRVFRTEINRAHGEAYMMTGEDLPGFAGWRYPLSPADSKPDIRNLYGTRPTAAAARAAVARRSDAKECTRYSTSLSDLPFGMR